MTGTLPRPMSGTVRPPSAPAISLGPSISVGNATMTSAHAVTNYPNGAPSSANPELVKVCPTCSVRYPAEFKVCPRDAAELAEVQGEEEKDDLVGKTLSSSYTILRVIGEG